MKNIFFTCPKMSLYLTLRLLIALLFVGLSIYVFWDMIFVAIAFSIFFIITSIILTVSSTCLSFRSFILVKVNEEGINNAFCKIKWDEITKIEYENLELENTRSTKRFGIVLIIYKNDDTSKSFKAYHLKEAICIPINEKTKKAILEYSPKTAEKFNISL